VAAPELPSQEGRAPSHGTCGCAGAHLSTEARSGAVGHMAVPEPTSPRRRGPELRDMWQRQSSPQHRGKIRGRGTCGSVGAHLSMEERSRAMGHMAAPEPTSTGRCGPKLPLTYQCVDARPAPYLDLELVCGIPDLQGADTIEDIIYYS
jgi:hypothetical protein